MVAIATSVSLTLWLTAPFGADFASGGDVIAELQIAPGVISALDAGTALNVIEDDDDVLSIELRSGALFLAVDSSKRKRVTVIAGGVTTKVTGTRFSVARLSGSVSVAVEEGSVSVGVPSQDDANAVIAGSAWIGTERGGAVVPVNVSEIASWRQGVLTVRNQPLRDVADILARRFTGQILFADATLANARVSGSFDLADPIEALRAAVSALDGRVMTVTPWLAIVAPK
ncbi:MAG: FecR domain-containing protein [Pseudomonadota bacterium]